MKKKKVTELGLVGYQSCVCVCGVVVSLKCLHLLERGRKELRSFDQLGETILRQDNNASPGAYSSLDKKEIALEVPTQ